MQEINYELRRDNMNRFQKGLLNSSWEFSITLKFPEISVGIKMELFGTAGNFPGKVIHL